MRLHHKNIKYILYGIITVLSVVVLVRYFNLTPNLFHLITNIPIWLIAALVIMQIISVLLVNLQWYCLLKITQPHTMSFWQVLQMNAKGLIMEAITPGVKFGGEVVRTIIIKKSIGAETHDAISSVVIQKFFSMSVFFILSAISMLYFIRMDVHDAIGVFYGLLLVLVFIVVVLAILFITRKHITKRPEHRKSTNRIMTVIVNAVIKLCTIFDFLMMNKLILLKQFLLAFIIWMMYPLKLYLILRAFDVDVSVLASGFIAFIAYTAAMIPIFPGGIGIFEFIMTYVLGLLHVADDVGMSVSIIFRFFTFWFVFVINYVLILMNWIFSKRGALHEK